MEHRSEAQAVSCRAEVIIVLYVVEFPRMLRLIISSSGWQAQVRSWVLVVTSSIAEEHTRFSPPSLTTFFAPPYLYTSSPHLLFIHPTL
jgi:hypothetical protein